MRHGTWLQGSKAGPSSLRFLSLSSLYRSFSCLYNTLAASSLARESKPAEFQVELEATMYGLQRLSMLPVASQPAGTGTLICGNE